MPDLLEKVQIQRLLVQAAKAAPFYPVSYDAAREPNPVDQDAVTAVSPQFPHANEVQASFFDLDRSYGQEAVGRRNDWTFILVCKFDQEVSAYAVEEAWLANPPRLVKDPANGVDFGATAHLQSVSYEHPPRESSSGSAIQFTFNVRVTRR